MVRDYVGGLSLPQYIRKYRLSWKLTLNLIELIEDFEKIGFTRLDMRCPHIFVQKDESVIVIDPRAHYTKNSDYPHNLAKGLRKIGVLQKFIYVLKKEKPILYNRWKEYGLDDENI